jgi:ABC-type Fe3+ transport system substrate-binding protein
VREMNRRNALAGGALAALGVFAAAGCSSTKIHQSGPTSGSAAEETQTLDQLHQAALAEGGSLIVYAGGDTANQQDANKSAFEKEFPGVTVTMVVDYSKFHDARIDYQLTTETLVPDVVQLQTLQDFDRWKQQGALLEYRPAGFGQVHTSFKDPDGHWTGIFVDAFSIIYNNQKADGNGPKSATDLLDSRWRKGIVSTYPNDDDAVLFLYKRTVDAHGWQWLEKFVQQDITWVRGTQEPADQVEAGKKPVAFGTDGALKPTSGSQTRFVVPESDPFLAWAQRAAILSKAAHPAAAKLYLNWWLTKQTQSDFYMWSVRTDVDPPDGYKHIWDYPNSNLDEFPKFMADRAALERFRQQITIEIGEVTGAPSPGWLGLHPGHG